MRSEIFRVLWLKIKYTHSVYTNKQEAIMAGLLSADAWNKIWTYRGTFLLGLENTAATAHKT